MKEPEKELVSKLVEISTMPLNNLIKWIDLNDYGYG